MEVTYDPKSGFLIQSKSTDDSELVGKYVCIATYKNKTEVVEATVHPMPSKNSQYLSIQSMIFFIVRYL